MSSNADTAKTISGLSPKKRNCPLPLLFGWSFFTLLIKALLANLLAYVCKIKNLELYSKCIPLT